MCMMYCVYVYDMCMCVVCLPRMHTRSNEETEERVAFVVGPMIDRAWLIRTDAVLVHLLNGYRCVERASDDVV